MSFNYKKPKLVEKKFIKYYKNIMDKQIQEEEIIKFEQSNIIPFHKKILNYIKDFIFDNYGFVILMTLITILLYVRYLEVNKRKQRIKELLNNIE